MLNIDFQMMVRTLYFEEEKLIHLLENGSLQQVQDEIQTAVEKCLGVLFQNIADQTKQSDLTVHEYAQFITHHYKKINKWRLYDEVHYEEFDELWVQFEKLRKQDKDYSIFTFIDEYVTSEHREKRRKAGG